MREKILAQLQAKFAGVSKTALGLIADKLAKKVTEESGIEQAITDFDNAVSVTEFAADLQREADRRVSEAQKEWAKKNPPKTEPPKTDDPPKNDDVPEWAKSLMEKVDSFTKEKAQTSIRAKAAEQLKDIPEIFWKGRAIPEKDEELDTFVAAIKEDHAAYQQTLVDKGLMTATPPAGGGSGKTGGKPDEKVLDAEIKAWAEKRAPVKAN